MKTISMVELRTQSERIVRDLKRGERMMLSYRGELLAEIVPSALAAKKLSPIEALSQAHELGGSSADASAKALSYLKQLRADQKVWSERASS
jgi:antitoxin (DNA-binding transcriptional repressor) of toxin-antitoxin stability system